MAVPFLLPGDETWRRWEKSWSRNFQGLQDKEYGNRDFLYRWLKLPRDQIRQRPLSALPSWRFDLRAQAIAHGEEIRRELKQRGWAAVVEG